LTSITDEKKSIRSPISDADGEWPIEAELVARSEDRTTGREVYHLVTDTVVGPNVRWKDNLFQAIAILVCIAMGVLIAWLVWRGPGEAIVGGFVGLLVGLFGSGIFLMIYRAVRHISGKHD
jgi:hypothetical protein